MGETPQPDYLVLAAVCDAYAVFCSMGWNYLTVRGLTVALLRYLVRFIHYKDGQPISPTPSHRSMYLKAMKPEHFHQLTIDTLDILLRRLGPQYLEYSYRGSSLIGPGYVYESVYNKMYAFSNPDLHHLLLDMTLELDRRKPLSGFLMDNHTSETDCGMYKVGSLLPSKAKPITTPITPRYNFGIIRSPRHMLRKAFRARRELEHMLKRVLSAPASPSASVEAVATQSPTPTRNPGISRWVDELPEYDSSDIPKLARLSTIGEEDIDSITLTDTRASLDRADATSVMRNGEDIDTIIEAIRHIFDEVPAETLKNALAELVAIQSRRSSLQAASAETRVGHSAPTSKKSSFLSSRLSTELQRTSYQSGTSNQDSFITAPSHIFLSQASLVSVLSQLLSRDQSFAASLSDLSTAITRDGNLDKRASIDTFLSFESTSIAEHNSAIYGAYCRILRERDLIPEPMIETNWSGRGQHTEYAPNERFDIPLEFEKVLGETKNALVESVRCKRVRLVRKTMRWPKGIKRKREEVIREVQHLYKVQHAHIVRLVGTYVMGNDLAILTYPCAEYNLEEYMRTLYGASNLSDRHTALLQFFTCLAKALDFMHSFPLKHMDIKPQNLLVREVGNSTVNGSDKYKVYYTDFGTSRSYASVDDTETETPTPFTRAYASKEVVLQELRGLSADIFSLGCVYVEMLAILLDAAAALRTNAQATPVYLGVLQSRRSYVDSGMRPYHSAAGDIRSWLHEVLIEEPELQSVRKWACSMLEEDPRKRPSARDIAEDPKLPFPCFSCTESGPEDFEAADFSMLEAENERRLEMKVPDSSIAVL